MKRAASGTPAIVDTPPTPRRDGGTGADPPHTPPQLHLAVHAEPAAAFVVRRSLREWLEALGWPEPDVDDIVIAVNEACTNAIEHAYPPENPGDVLIEGSIVHIGYQRHVDLAVQDRGRWRPAPAPQKYRGHGMTVMRGCMHTVNIAPGIEDTVVTLASFSVPPHDGERSRS
jgi:anti-sigma regulatory factor (Ser/Thr protein kinase)